LHHKEITVNNIHIMKGVASAAGGIALILAGTLATFVRTHADERDAESESRIEQGLAIAPVPLNLQGKDRDLVGLGSYWVNAVAGCNDCHTAPPPLQWAPGGNPYFKGNPPKVVNQSTYLGGGRIFTLAPGTPSIVSRNLTPDRTGRPAGGRTFAEFVHIMRSGEDLDHLHPNCSSTVVSNCFPAFLPFNGDLLQIMPWPNYQSMQEHDLRAIYEYLSAVPCVTGPPSGELHNDCT
jgi:hypothetical protein